MTAVMMPTGLVVAEDYELRTGTPALEVSLEEQEREEQESEAGAK